MRLLLDTHVLIWVATADPSLSAEAAAFVVDPGNEVFISAASFYEIEFKRRRGRMPRNLPGDVLGLCIAEGYALLDITPDDASDAARLPEHHRDPWDRVLVAQAMRRGMSIVTKDTKLADYGVPTIW